MKTIIGFIFGILFIMVICCGDYNPSNPNNIRMQYADQFNFNKYAGKTVQYIKFLEYPHTVTGCHDFIIHFTDGTEIRMFINKYTPEIEIK